MDNGVMAESKNQTYYLKKALIENLTKRAKVENRSANNMLEIFIAEGLRRRGVELGPDFPDPDARP